MFIVHPAIWFEFPNRNTVLPPDVPIRPQLSPAVWYNRILLLSSSLTSINGVEGFDVSTIPLPLELTSWIASGVISHPAIEAEANLANPIESILELALANVDVVPPMVAGVLIESTEISPLTVKSLLSHSMYLSFALSPTINLPSGCRWKLLDDISILASEPEINWAGDTVLGVPKKNSSVTTWNVDGFDLNLIYLSTEPCASTISNPTPSYASDDDSRACIEPLNKTKPPLPLAITLSNPAYPIERINDEPPYNSIPPPAALPRNTEPLIKLSSPSIFAGAPSNSTCSVDIIDSAKLLFIS